MTDLRERVARAIYEIPTFGVGESDADWEPWADADNEIRENYRHEADVAIAIVLAEAVKEVEANAEASRLTAEVERLRAALTWIGKHKKTDELILATDVEYAAFEDDYDACIDRARTALQPPSQEESV